MRFFLIYSQEAVENDEMLSSSSQMILTLLWSNKCYALHNQKIIHDVYTINGQVFAIVKEESEPNKISLYTDLKLLNDSIE